MKIQPGMPGNNAPGIEQKANLKGGESLDKDWTILLYLDGNNNIEGDILNSFLTVEEVSEHGKINMLAELGRAPQSIAHKSYTDDIDGDWDGVRRYVVKKGKKDPYGSRVWTSLGTHDAKIDSEMVENLGKADMSDPENLKNFLQWGIKNYPAKHYAVILASHGSGFLGSLSDYKSRRHMNLGDMARTFEEVKQKTGIKPDLLVMDACLMAGVEAAHELKDAADFYLASQDYNYDCLPIQKTMEEVHKKLDKGEEVSPADMTEILVDQGGKFHHVRTISAIKTSQLDSFGISISKLADSLIASDTDPAIIRDIISSTRGFAGEDPKIKPYSDFKDVGDLAMRISVDGRIEDEGLKEAARNLSIAMDDNLIISEAHDSKYDTGNKRRVHGLTIYIPTTGFNYDKWEYKLPYDTNKSEYEGIYRSLDFTRKTGWDKVIDKYCKQKGKNIKGIDVINKLIRGKK